MSTASGVVGTDVAALLGATLLGLFHLTLAEQAELERAERRRFLALIDEFQVFLGADFGAMLAELRKYGGSFGLATQSLSYLDRLDRTLRSTVLANVDHLFAFDMTGVQTRLRRQHIVKRRHVESASRPQKDAEILGMAVCRANQPEKDLGF